MKRAFHSSPAPSFFPNRFIFLTVRLRGREEKREPGQGNATEEERHEGGGRPHVHAQRNRNVALLPFSKTGRGNTRALRPFPKAETLKKAHPFQETGELTRLSDSSEMQVWKRRGTYVPSRRRAFFLPSRSLSETGREPRPVPERERTRRVSHFRTRTEHVPAPRYRPAPQHVICRNGRGGQRRMT